MMNGQEEANRNGENEENGKYHSVQPLRDLESNWGVDLAKNLEEYLLKICSGEITRENYDEGHHISVNFAEENGNYLSVEPLRDLESNWGVDLAKNLEEYLLKICSGEITHENFDDGHHLSVNFAEENGKYLSVEPLRDLESNWSVDLAKNLEEYLLKICSGEITRENYDEGHHLSVNFAEENGKYLSVEPLRDLESNWSVDLTKNLEEYLLKICSGEITRENYDDGHHLSVNFAEAALLLQGSVQVYSRKVEYLYSLVLHALEFITKKSEPELQASGSAQADEDGLPAANNGEDDSFWASEEIPVETKNMLDNTACRDSFTQFVKAPANLVVLEGDCLDVTGDAGELESYLLATCDLYRDFILLDACDSVTVDGFLDSENIAGKGLNNSCRGSSLKSKYRKSFSSPAGLSGGTGNKSSARKNQDANLHQSPRVHEFDPGNLSNDPHEFYQGNFNNDPFSSDMPDNINDAHGCEDGYSEPHDSDDSDNEEDPWKPLNPHEPGTLKVKPYKKVKSNRRQGVVSRKLASLATEFPLAKLHGTTSTDLNDMWEKKCCAMSKQVDSQYPPPFEKLRESLLHGVNNDYDGLCSPKNTNENDDYDGADHDFGPPDFDMPEYAEMQNDATPLGEKHDNCSPLFDSEPHEDLNGHENLEDLCRSHLDSLLASLAETEKQTELAARVSTWKQRIEQNLEEQESHPPFDIHEYGARVLSKLSLEEIDKSTMSFSDVVKGSEKHDIARTFSALLQLVNNGDVGLERGGVRESICFTAANPFSVRLLRHENGREKMQFQSSRKRAKSPVHNQYSRKEKNKGKAVQAVVGSSPSGPNSGCRFSLKLGKVNGTRCTPESKKRRKSRLVIPSDLRTAL